MKKKHQKDAEKAEKLKEKVLLEKARKAAAALLKKRSSGLIRKSSGDKKRRKSTGSVNSSMNPEGPGGN